MIKADRTYLAWYISGSMILVGFGGITIYFIAHFGWDNSGILIFSLSQAAAYFAVCLLQGFIFSRMEHGRQDVARFLRPTIQLLPNKEAIIDGMEEESEEEDPSFIEDDPEVDEEIESEPDVIALPWILKWRPSLLVLLVPTIVYGSFVVAGLLLVLLGVFFQISDYNSGVPTLDAETLLYVFIFAAFIIVVQVFYGALVWMLGMRRLIIAEDGIMLRKVRSTRAIRWDEARLFFKSGLGPRGYYELSSETAIIRWQEDWTLGALKVNFNDTDIANANDFVVARTGLPLVKVAPKS